MADLDTFKRRVGYQVGADQDAFTGNGQRVSFQLRHENVSEPQVYFNGALQLDSLYELDGPPGVMTFTAAPADEAVVTIDYKFAAFTDTEANALISEFGLQKAVIEALREVLANTARLRNYKQGDTEVDNSQVFKQVKQLLDMYVTEYQQDQSAEASSITVSKRKDPRGGPEYCQEPDLSRLYG